MNSPYTTGQMMFPVAGSVSGAPQDQYSRNYPPQVGMTRPLNAPPSDQMYFEPNTNRLYIPRAGFIPAMRAVSTSRADQQQRRPRGIEAPAAAAKLSSEQVSELKKQLLPELRRELAAQLEMEVEQKEAVLESKWFGLPPNTYGAGIWAVLVLEVEATGLDLLVRGRQSEDVPMNQRWEKSAKLWFIDDPYQWFTKRFAPFVRSIFFQLSTVLLSCISWLLQFGFTYALDQKIGGATFFDNPSSRNICATSGWVQFLSVGFFLAFMIGQVPNLLRNILLIWTSTKETDEVRGEKDAKDLYVAGSKDDVSRMLREAKMYTPSMEGMLPERRANTIHRTYASHVFRRLISTLFPLAEASIIGYLMYVGVKYIFWSGWVAVERTSREFFPTFPLDEQGGFFPWMTNTDGVEEIIMATLALQFIVDIDEAIFLLVLPKSLQNSVSETKLNCAGWLPTSFRRSDFVSIGKHDYGERDRPKKKKRADLEEEYDDDYWDVDPDTEKGYERSLQFVCGFLRLKVLKKIDKDHEEARSELDEMRRNLNNTRGVVQQSGGWGACCPRPGTLTKGLPLDDQLPMDIDMLNRTLQVTEKKVKRYEKIFERGWFWKLYCRAMKDTLEFARYLEGLEEKEANITDNEEREELMTSMVEVWNNMYYEFDNASFLWNDENSSFWGFPEDGAEGEEGLELERFLLEVSHKVANQLLSGAGAPRIQMPMRAKTVAASTAATEMSKWEYGTDSGSTTDDESEYNFEDSDRYEEGQVPVSRSQKLRTEIDSLGSLLSQQNSALSDIDSDYDNKHKADKIKFFKRMRNECSQQVNLSEEFVSKPVRLKWMNLLPDSTFLLTFLLIAMPAFVVQITRARCGCKSFFSVDVDDIESLELKSSNDVLEDESIMAPLVIVVIIALIFTATLVWNTLLIWQIDDDARKFMEKRLKHNKKKQDNEPAADVHQPPPAP